MLQRDGFIDEIYKALEVDKNIYFLSADFGAASLDDLRIKYKDNFIHCGISEQNMIDVAVGLALEGKKVFCYAMAPFISLRALEQIKTGPGIMNLPITLISVGIGIGYADSGPTHYVTEEFACLRSIIGVNIFTASDTSTARYLAKDLLSNPRFAYVRLDRHALPEVENFENYQYFRYYNDESNNNLAANKIALISHGKMLHVCSEVVKEAPNDFIAIDLIQSKPFPREMIQFLSKTNRMIVVDEQTPSGSLGSAVFEAFSEVNLFPKIINVTLHEKYFFENIGRDGILSECGLTVENIIKQSKRFEI
jgi:transketolase